MKRDMGHRKWLDEYPALKQVDESSRLQCLQAILMNWKKHHFSDTIRRIKVGKRLYSAKKLFWRAKRQHTKPHKYWGNLQHGKFTTPENYFDELSGNIQSRVTIEEFETGKGLTVPEQIILMS